MTEEKICVIGLGYVGLPLAVEFSKHFPVIGFDVNEKRIEQLKKNIDDSGETNSTELENCQIDFTSNQEKIKESNFIIVCVPTPVDDTKRPDMSFLKNASEVIGKNLSSGSVVVYESTVYPGCTEEICLPILEKFSGLKCGEDFKIGYSPERINPGDKEHTIDKIIKIVSGIDSESLERISFVYGKIAKAGVHKAKDIKTAEAAKVIENIQRDLNIALMNELTIIFDKIGVKTKDVLDAAGTKWNWHKYYPGLVGGHCFEKSSTVFLINSGHQKIKQIGPYIDSLECKKQVYQDVEIFYPTNVKVLSYDMIKNKTSFKPVTIASKRKADEVINIRCAYNYNLEVTNIHPVVIYDDGLKVKFAKEIKIGDKLVLNKVLPSKKRIYVIDILDYLDKDLHKKIRVKIKGKKISEFRSIINKNIKGKKGNYYHWDYLPLEKYLTIEKKLNIPRKNIYLCTGRGSCSKKFPLIFKITNDFIRLVGYYLSEGCITNDKSLRTRFTFHKDEIEYMRDVTNILKNLNIDYSIYHDKNYKASTIKVSSYFFGLLIRDILRCGTNCYSMQIPEIFLDLNKKAKEELLKGLFRGDGGVSWYNGEKKYTKKGKIYTHNSNSLEVSYFTSSPKLFQQVILFLLNQDIIPRLAKREGYLSLMGYRDVKKVENWFLGDKKKKIDNYFTNKQKKTTYKVAKRYKDFITLNITNIEKKRTDYVYSMEVEDTNTLITSNGIIAHNCIPVDPHYLTFKAEELGYNPEVILAGRRINDNMHKFVVEKVIKKLNSSGKVLKESKVLVLGLTFKADVKDHRNSRAKHLIKELKDYEISIIGCDPLLENELVEREFGVKNCSISELGVIDELKEIDAVVFGSHHKQFKEIDWEQLGNPIVIDLKEI